MSEIFHPCSLCNAHASFYKDPEQSIREAIVLEIEALLCGDSCLGVNQEHCDNIKEAITIVRGNNDTQ